MGHDIYARRVDEKGLERLEAAFDAKARGLRDKAWLKAYEEFSAAANVAYLRRGAFNELNSVIYRALDCMDAYAGVSGNGVERTFTRAQIERAFESLPGCEAGADPGSDGERAIQATRAVFEKLANRFPGDAIFPPGATSDLRPEYDFLRDVLRWMDAERRDSVTIFFG